MHRIMSVFLTVKLNKMHLVMSSLQNSIAKNQSVTVYVGHLPLCYAQLH